MQQQNTAVQTAIPAQPVTVERPLYNPVNSGKLVNPGTGRANLAATADQPRGTQSNKWASDHSKQTVLQQHCDFFDPDNDSIVWPLDTYRGFHDLGFNILLSVTAMFIIHASFSYATVPGYLPDPFFRLHLKNIHKAKHGSDSGIFDNEGRFIPQKFEDFFSKYADGKDGLTMEDVLKALKGQRLLMDFTGWIGAFFEWLSIYIFLWPEDGMMKKEDIRRVLDGSIFSEAASKRAGRKKTKAT